MGRRQVIIGISLLVVIALLVYGATFRTKALRATLGGEALLLEIADTDALRVQGLSGHRPLEPNEGMLFVFPSNGAYGFWMKDMLFPIDILWLDEQYRIVDVKDRAMPGSYPKIFTPRAPARYVLELPAGFFLEHHLELRNTLEISP